MKNMKIAAAAMVMVMLASAAIVGIGASAYDADNTNQDPAFNYGYTVNLTNKETIAIELASNVKYYSDLTKVKTDADNDDVFNTYASANYTFIGWTVKYPNPNPNPNDPNDPKLIDATTEDKDYKIGSNLKVSPNIDGKFGNSIGKPTANISMTFTRSGNISDVNLYLTATITVVMNGASVELDPVVYKISVIFDEGENEYTFNSMTFIKGVSKTEELKYSTTVENEDGTVTVHPVDFGDSVLFYAIGLPKGISMTHDGKISGMAIESRDTPYDAKIFIEKSNGTVITGTLEVTVQDFAYKVYASATIGAGSTPLTAGTNNTYIIEEEQKLSVKTETEGANYISVCNQNGASTLVSITNNTCDLRDYTSGTGAYKVYIGYADGSSPTSLNKVLASFDLYVVGHVVGIGSDIIIGSR